MPNYDTTAGWLLRKFRGNNPIKDIDDGFAALADDVDARLTVLLPIGAYLDRAGYPADSSDGRLLIADGRSLLRSDYSDLFTLLGTLYGAADATHFNLPDRRRRVHVPASSGHNPGEAGGEETHKLTAGESGTNGSGSTAAAGAHNHSLSGGQLNGGGGIWQPRNNGNTIFQNTPFAAGGGQPGYQFMDGISLYDPDLWITVDGVGGHGHALSARAADDSHQNMQPHLVGSTLIRVR